MADGLSDNVLIAIQGAAVLNKTKVTQLVKYEAACRALAEAKAVDEVKSLRDKSIALKEYARQAQNKQLEVDAAEIRFRAERRLGEMLKEQDKRGPQHSKGGGSKGSKREPLPDAPPTLSDIGIDKKLSSRAQKLAAVPEKKFEGMIGEWRERVGQENERVTSKLLREGERHQKAQPIEEEKCPVCGQTYPRHLQKTA